MPTGIIGNVFAVMIDWVGSSTNTNSWRETVNRFSGHYALTRIRSPSCS